MTDDVRVIFGKTLISLLEKGGYQTFRRAVHSSPQPTADRHRYAIWLCYMACRLNATDWAVAQKVLATYGKWSNLTDLQLHRLAQWEQYIREVRYDGHSSTDQAEQLYHAGVSTSTGY